MFDIFSVLFSPCRPGFDPRVVHVKSVMNKVTMGGGLSPSTLVYLVNHSSSNASYLHTFTINTTYL